jgi:hypothetical protein
MVTVLLVPALRAAPPKVGADFEAVWLDGVRLGEDTTPQPAVYSAFPTIVYDAPTGLFHLWVSVGRLAIEDTVHATSTDGVHFASTGKLVVPDALDWTQFGMPVDAEPMMAFVRASKVDGVWKLMYWTDNGPGEEPPQEYGLSYNYNSSMNDLGADPWNLVVTHQGPLGPTPGGTFGQTIGPWGLVDTANGTYFFTSYDPAAGIGKFTYADATPPQVSVAPVATEDLVAGTGYTWFLTDPAYPDAPPTDVYIHNVGRVLAQPDGTLGAFYSLRYWTTGARVNAQIYYAESADGGDTWTAPVGLFPEQAGPAVRVDGAPATFGFSHPEAVVVGSRRVVYFSTKGADGKLVVVTNAGTIGHGHHGHHGHHVGGQPSQGGHHGRHHHHPTRTMSLESTGRSR